MLLLHGQAVAGDGQGIGNEGLVLLHGLVDREGCSHVLHHCTDADRQAAGTHLAVHHGLDKLLLAALRILLLERKYLDVVGKLCNSLAHGLNSLGLVLLDADDGAAASEHLLHDGCADDDLLRALEHDAEVAGKIGLALRSVQDQALGHAAGSGIEFDMRGKGGSAESDHAASLDLVEDGRAVIGDFGNQGIGKIHALYPLVAFYGYFNVHHIVAGKVLAGCNGLHGAGCGRMHEGGDESAGFGYHLPCLHLVADSHYRLRRGAKMLCHRHIHSLRKRQHLDCAAARQFCIIRMHTANCKRNLTHWEPPF